YSEDVIRKRDRPPVLRAIEHVDLRAGSRSDRRQHPQPAAAILLDDPVQRSAWRDAQRPAAKMAELRFARSHAEHEPELGRSHFDIAVRWIARGPVWKAQETDVLAASVVQRQGRTLRRCKVCHEAPGAQA